ncbi:HupE/UreJ family protein [Gryllotalpicola protaetiae]|uniref:HupE/UreJ family protein n=1 Tax=Gryllotalpicola protaetiae TaxID=2419771 RepID=A0A387BSR6_9MICO|nr:HupE/UreJ family protein [Gryllotalpicola protaetiae]AYG05114.1 HupE/UreJ family protein [Gryllotalpicola protaetiae]
MPARARGVLVTLLVAVAVVAFGLIASAPASAHGFTSVVYATVAGDRSGHVRAALDLEYDLLVVSAADAQNDDGLFQEGQPAFDHRDEAAEAGALENHSDTVLGYVSKRFTVMSAGSACTPKIDGSVAMKQRDGAPYATVVFDYACPKPSSAHVIGSTLFPDAEGYVRDTKTVLTYNLDTHSGSAALDAQQPSFSTEQSTGERFWEFFRLGSEHLLTGIDHILFLLALIAGSRRLREVVYAATTFTIAHSVTFILAATHLVSAPSSVVEPIIALSITAVAVWYLLRLWQGRADAARLDIARGPLGLDRPGWLRLGVVFVFGLVHGLGFASALGIDEPWSWTLLWSLLVFNVGIEVVQLSIIALVFPLLALLRHRSPRLFIWVTVVIATGVSIAGLVWFVQRVLGL